VIQSDAAGIDRGQSELPVDVPDVDVVGFASPPPLSPEPPDFESDVVLSRDPPSRDDPRSREPEPLSPEEPPSREDPPSREPEPDSPEPEPPSREDPPSREPEPESEREPPSLEPEPESPEPEPESDLAAALVRDAVLRSFFAQPLPLNTIAGGAKPLRNVASAPHAGQKFGADS
jgi:hypothetical protein